MTNIKFSERANFCSDLEEGERASERERERAFRLAKERNREGNYVNVTTTTTTGADQQSQ